MIARALVAQRLVDQDEIGRRPERHELTGRGHADEKPAAGDEQLLGDQYREGRTDRATDDTELDSGLDEAIEFSVIASPGGIQRRAALCFQAAHQIAVGVEEAN